jgi:hypothetical protein
MFFCFPGVIPKFGGLGFFFCFFYFKPFSVNVKGASSARPGALQALCIVRSVS